MSLGRVEVSRHWTARSICGWRLRKAARRTRSEGVDWMSHDRGRAKRKQHGGKQRKHRKDTPTGVSSQHQPQPNPDRTTIQMGVSAARRLVVPILTVVGLILVIKLFLNTPIGVRFVAVSASLMVIYDVFDAVNWKRTSLMRERGLWRPLGIYMFWFGATVAVAAAGFIVSAGSWQCLAVVAVFALVAFRRPNVEADICEQFPELDLKLPPPIWGKRFAEWVDTEIGTYADRPVDNATPFVEICKQTVARSIRNLPFSPHHDGRRAVAVFGIAAAVLFGGWVGVVWAKRNAHDVAHEVKVVVAVINPFGSSGRENAETPDTSRIAANSTAEAARSPGNAAPVAPEVVTSPRLLNECPTPLVTTGPRWVREDLTALYLGGAGPGASEAPGTAIAGCPGSVHLSHTPLGLFAYTLGQNPTSNQTQSIGVASQRFGGATLFLTPAVKPVLTLIERFKNVGGIRRYPVSGGDFYPVQTPAGTYILIRRETGTEQAAEPYTVVPPVVSQAWALATAKSQTIMWPVARHENGETIYDFDSNSTPSRVLYTFPYRPSNTIEPELSGAELEGVASRGG